MEGRRKVGMQEGKEEMPGKELLWKSRYWSTEGLERQNVRVVTIMAEFKF